jgi:hypothetical protein
LWVRLKAYPKGSFQVLHCGRLWPYSQTLLGLKALPRTNTLAFQEHL